MPGIENKAEAYYAGIRNYAGQLCRAYYAGNAGHDYITKFPGILCQAVMPGYYAGIAGHIMPGLLCIMPGIL